MPLSKRIQQTKLQLSAEKDRNENITDVVKLRKQVLSYCDRIDKDSDTNKWVQYILDGLRNFKVKLRTMESKQPRRIGPYQGIILSMEIEGTYSQLKNVVEWLEQSEKLLRIDSMRFEKRPQYLLMKISVLGIVPKKNV